MSVSKFELNDDTLSVIEEIGGHMPGGFFIYESKEPERILYANKEVFNTFSSGMILQPAALL